MGFAGMYILVPRKGERAKVVSEDEMNYLNHGYNVILDIRFTFCCFK